MTVELFLTILVLGFASFRITRFIVWSSLIGTGCDGQPIGTGYRRPDTPIGIAVSEFAYKPNGEYQGWFRGKIGDLLTCTWCTGFWVSTVAYFMWFDPALDSLGFRDGLMCFAIAGVQSLLNARNDTIPVEVG